MFFGSVRNSKLRAYAISGTDDNSVFRLVSRSGKIKQATETSEVSVTTGASSTFAMWFDQFNQAVSFVNVNPSICVTDDLSSNLIDGFNESNALLSLNFCLECFRRIALVDLSKSLS